MVQKCVEIVQVQRRVSTRVSEVSGASIVFRLQLWSWVHFVDHGLSQGLQDLTLVIIKISIYLVDGFVLYHPQLALSLRDEPGVVANDDHSWKSKKCGDECWSLESFSPPAAISQDNTLFQIKSSSYLIVDTSNNIPPHFHSAQKE